MAANSEVGSGLPCTPTPALASGIERSIWVASRLNPSAYETRVVFELAAAPSVEELIAALETLSAWHPLLRGRYGLVGSEVYRTVVPDGPPVTVLTAACGQHDGVVDTLTIVDGLGGVDLEHGPVARFALVDDGTGRITHVGLAIHHIVMDRASIEILGRDLDHLLGADTADLPVPPSYDEFCERMGRLEADPSLGAHRDRWVELSRSWPTRATVVQPIRDSSCVHFEIDQPPVRSGASGRRLMPTTPWLAAAYVVAAAASRSPVVACVMPSSLRTAEFDRTVGCLVNLLPVLLTATPATSLGAVPDEVDSVLRAVARDSILPAVGSQGAGRATSFPAFLYFEHLGPLSATRATGSGVVLVDVPVRHNDRPRYPLEVRARTQANGVTTVSIIASSESGQPLADELGILFRRVLSLWADPGNGATPTLGALLGSVDGHLGSGPAMPDSELLVAVDTGLVARVTASWQDALADAGLAVARDTNFFDIGGDSLGALIVVQILNDELGVELPITFVFDNPTIDDQVRGLMRLGDDSSGGLDDEA